jgi:5-formyltetrahydrofolate cyclo-ligase
MPSPEQHHGFIPSSAEDVMRARVKVELRKRMRALRKALPASACAERSGRIAGNLATLGPVAKARSIALFWPIADRHEVDLLGLDARLRGMGLRVAYPAIDPDTGFMHFRFAEDPNAMVEHSFGFREPAPTAPEAAPGDLDVIVVPALAVDPRGHRIGYGAGYYDRALPVHAPPAVTVAVAFDFQLVSETPNSPVDVPIDWIVTDVRAFVREP